MKSMKTRFMNKFNFTAPITTLKHTLLPLQIPAIYNATDQITFMDTRDQNQSPLSHFEEKSPPGGTGTIILYTTSLRSIRKTFEDCHTIMFLLDSFKVNFHVRDVSMHMEFREELWRIMGGKVIPPRLFIKGRYIGGADEVVSLHEQGELKSLLQGLPQKMSSLPCVSCFNRRFLVCSTCHGCRKLFSDGGLDDQMGQIWFVRCPDCNENGLVKCSFCT